MSTGTDKWSDLLVRLSSAAVMIVAGAVSVWFGGWVFHVVVAAVCGLMIWELVRMIAPNSPKHAIELSVLSFAVSLIAIAVPIGLALPALMVPALVGFMRLASFRKTYVVFAALVLFAGLGMMLVRDILGFGWMVWLVLIVVVTDVVGYFAGRMIGGPKFWPRVSPKKTWAGTASGWLGAALVGFWYMLQTGMGLHIVGVSVAVSVASQMGDIAESAMKRRVGVKDSSHLIPGHGGLMDRFDGMMGAALLMLLVFPVLAFPVV